MRAVEKVTADRANHTPDLGGKATTRSVTDAVKKAIARTVAFTDDRRGASQPVCAIAMHGTTSPARPGCSTRRSRPRSRALRVPPLLPAPPAGRLVVIGAGKASAAMAKAVEDHWPGELSGLVVTRYGHAVPCKRIEIVEAAHPVPDDAASERAARRLLEAVERPHRDDDLVLCLISGGGSSLLVAAAARAHAGGQAGGQPRAAASPGREHRRDELRAPPPVGDQGRAARRGLPSGAGRDAADLRRARRRPDRHRVRARPSPIRRPAPTRSRSSSATASTLPRARAGSAAKRARRKRQAGRPALARHRDALDRDAADGARGRGGGCAAMRRCRSTSWATASRARRATSARSMAGIALQVAQHGQPFAPPCILLSGGETTVTVRGQGRGGRNVEFLLSLGGRARRGDRHSRAGRRHRRRRRRSRRSPAPISRPTRWRAPGLQGIKPEATPGRQRRPRLLRGARRCRS